jgi:ABC-type transport system involved in multi-copper enzyme maturation permease subunit
MDSILTIARLTFQEAARRRILLAAFVLGLLFLAIFGLGFHFIMKEVEKELDTMSLIQLNEMRNFLLMAGMYVVNFLTVMMTVLTSVDTLSGEISSGTIHTLVSKPIQRRDVLLGKWLGFAGMISLYLLLMAGGVMGLIYLRSGYTANHPLQAIAMIWLNAILLLSVSLLGGTLLSTLANGVLVFGLFGVAFIGGWIEQIGAFFTNQAAGRAAVNIGIITSLLMPSEALWKRAAYEVQSPLSGALGFSPFVANSIPSPLMIAYAGFYLLVILFFAVYVFKRRDL